MQNLLQDDTRSTDRNEFQGFQANNWTINLASKLKCNSPCHLKPGLTGTFYYSELGMKLIIMFLWENIIIFL